VFYPPGLPHARELEYAARRLGTIEINGTFYALQRPQSYLAWRDRTSADFVFSVKAPRFITHLKKLRDAETPLANFFASGVLALADRLGPVLWQLPPSLGYHPDRIEEFLDRLPMTTGAAAELARRHDGRLEGRSWAEVPRDRPLRHAMEVRHATFVDARFVEQLRRHAVALVTADTAGTWPYLEDLTADFAYVRLHGDEEIYASGYSASALDAWAATISGWARGESPGGPATVGPPGPVRPEGRDVFVYFDNEVKVRAPFDAMALAERLGCGPVPPADGPGAWHGGG
jgi:uncharacterized protein YecE (DUF72 family)